MANQMTCIECSGSYEYPTGKIVNGMLTCMDCMIAAETARRTKAVKATLVVLIVLANVVTAAHYLS